MALEASRKTQYEYKSNSNLVLTTEHRSREHEPTGEPESLVGKKIYRMGDRAIQRSLPGLEEKKEKKRRAKQNASKETGRSRKASRVGPQSVADAVGDIGIYKPKTRETRLAHEQMLDFLQRSMGDQPADILRGAADEILSIFKNERLREAEKKKESEKLLNTLSQERFAELAGICLRITDYSPEEDDDIPGAEEELGVSVVFDEEEEEDDSDLDEVANESDEDEDEGADIDPTSGHGLQVKSGMIDDLDDEEDDEDIIKVENIDAYWIQREISKVTGSEDHNVTQKMAQDVLGILSAASDDREVENQLVVMLDYEKFDFIKILLKNRMRIVFCTRLLQAQNDQERKTVEDEMRQTAAGERLLAALEYSHKTEGERKRDFERSLRKEVHALKGKQGAGDQMDDGPGAGGSSGAGGATAKQPRQILDLDSLAFSAGSHFMANKKVDLHDKCVRTQFKGYEEVYVPAQQARDTGPGVAVADMPDWAQIAFKNMKSLNYIQSTVYKTALFEAENLLICAPTGAGKTNCSMLCILHEIGLCRQEDGTFDLSNLKMVYVAPMKALVAEMVLNLGSRLEPYGVVVKELSGDVQLTKSQISETHLIITTPEKWDIVTRKSGDRAYTQQVRLIIIDEIHLLHDERGPVLESIVARTIRQIETTQEMIRIVGLSATLPNYQDVATFLRVKHETGMFFFDNSCRPVPLHQQYIGVSVKKALQRFQLMNEITYDKVMQNVSKGHQVLVFVHSRKETVKTARALHMMAEEHNALNQLTRDTDTASLEVCRDMSETAKGKDLQDLLQYRLGVHHAGMTRGDRELVESLFADGHINVLVSTATLAWGVNLPAHTVIIKGTQIYSPEQGRWVELSSMDVMQMLGRAGRPQYDTHGEGIIITNHSELIYYLSLLNHQLPIESQFIKKLPDMLNAEVVLGTVQNIREAASWLSYTYLFVRMRRNPQLYGVTDEEAEEDPTLEQRRMDLVHSAATMLFKANLVKYDRKTGALLPTDLGRVASHYYVAHSTISTYNEHLKPTVSDIELFRLFSLSGEFRNIVVRAEEKLELQKLVERVPIPVKESIDEPTAKVNVLLQAYISQLKLEGFALISDMVYVQQSAGRLMRALFEIALKRGWAALAMRTLSYAQMIDRRMWSSMSPLRQFKSIPEDVIKKIEKKDFAWERLYDLTPQEIGELIRFPKMGKTIHKHVHQFPKLELAAHVQPITRGVLRVDLTITPDFQWDEKVHGAAELFWVLVEDVDGENILHHEVFTLKARFVEEEHVLNFTVPLFDPLPPQYFIRIVSDRWLGSHTVLPVSFRHLILPEKYPPHTDLLDLQPLPVSALRNPSFQALYEGEVTVFNPIQTQVFNTLYNTNDNVLIGAPTGSGKTICAEFAIMHAFSTNPDARCVYVAPTQEIVTEKLGHWQLKFGQGLRKTVVELTGETSADLKLLEKGNIVLSTPERWDILSRRWKQRKNVQNVQLFVVDELHLIGGDKGPVLEIIISRMRCISSQIDNPIRIVGLSASLANARDLGEWIGASTSHGLFNFHPNVRPVPLEIHIQGFDQPHASSRILAMARPTYTAIVTHSPTKPAIVFVGERRQARATAIDIMMFASVEDNPQRFLHLPPDDMNKYVDQAKDSMLKQTMSSGILFLHEALGSSDKSLVMKLFAAGACQILVASHAMLWSLNTPAHLCIMMGTQHFDGREHRYIDYPITDVLQMMGLASRPNVDDSGKCSIFCHAAKKAFYIKFLDEPFPVESHIDHALHDCINAEIVCKTIENKQEAVDYLTWTFYYRRLTQNPNYYNMQGTSHRHVSDHLSDLVESVISDLENSKCITVEDDSDLAALNLGLIASYYYISYTTIELFSSSLRRKHRWRPMIDLISNSTEFDDMPIRHKEERALKQLSHHMPHKIDNPKYTDPHTKANLLLQAHFSRARLSAELASDQSEVVLKSLRLIMAMVDVISSNGWLKACLAAMELSQMVVQAVWNTDSQLLQLPHMDAKLVSRCNEAGIQDIYEIVDMEDDARRKLLGLSDSQLADIARVCNRFPTLEMEVKVVQEEEEEADVRAGDTIMVQVTLQRELDDSLLVPPIVTPFFPKPKEESWWVVIGDLETDTLLTVKRATLNKKTNVVNLDFEAKEAGDKTFQCYLMSDCWSGCDQEVAFNVKVGEAIADDAMAD